MVGTIFVSSMMMIGCQIHKQESQAVMNDHIEASKQNEDIQDASCDISYIVDNENKDAAAIEHEIDAKKDAAEQAKEKEEVKQIKEPDKVLEGVSSKETDSSKEKEVVNQVEKTENVVASAKETDESASDKEPIDYKKFFKDTIFLGDSITEFFTAAELLPDKNVISEKGKTVTKALANDIDTIKFENPKNIVMLFGTNDVLCYSNSDLFKKKYLELVSKLKEELPDTTIYIEASTPIRKDAEREGTNFNNEEIAKFRQAAQEVAAETNSTYIDITTLITDDSYFEADGVHFKRKFYDALLKMLSEELQDGENNEQ